MQEYAVSNEGMQVMNTRAFEGLMAAENEKSWQFQQIFDVIPQHMFLLGSDATLTFANRAAREYLGPIEAAPPAMQLAKMIHPEDLDSLLQTFQDARAHGISVEAEARVKSKGGQYRWFLHQLFPMRDEAGDVVRWCGTRIDIDAQKESKHQPQPETLGLEKNSATGGVFEGIVGTSARLQAVLARVGKVAGTDSTVFITGETGTGKELIARAIHNRSRRADRPFISVNCAAIPRDLVASELFGHEKGAFTGALQRRVGRFEAAQGGTLFLDEIGELPAETQVALLRVLQEREFQRVGSNQLIQANVRVIVATHRDLPAAIAAGTFRSDLYYRINVFPIEMPPLRERKADVRLLVEHFVECHSRKAGKQIRRIEKKSLEFLQSYSWPGNIRELQNVIERSVILCDSESFSVDESWLEKKPEFATPLSQEMSSQEKGRIEAALAECKGRVSGPSGAAIKLGLPPSTLDSKIRALRIDKCSFYSN